jgi:hypothetical protein
MLERLRFLRRVTKYPVVYQVTKATTWLLRQAIEHAYTLRELTPFNWPYFRWRCAGSAAAAVRQARQTV